MLATKLLRPTSGLVSNPKQVSVSQGAFSTASGGNVDSSPSWVNVLWRSWSTRNVSWRLVSPPQNLPR